MKEKDVFDGTEVYMTQIRPLVNELKTLCEEHRVPFVFSAAVKETGKETAYENTIFSGQSYAEEERIDVPRERITELVEEISHKCNELNICFTLSMALDSNGKDNFVLRSNIGTVSRTYNHSDVFNEKIEPLLKDVMVMCHQYKIPFFFSASISSDGTENKYCNEMVSPAVSGHDLSNDIFSKFVKVIKGYNVVHPHDVFEVEEIDV